MLFFFTVFASTALALLLTTAAGCFDLLVTTTGTLAQIAPVWLQPALTLALHGFLALYFSGLPRGLAAPSIPEEDRLVLARRAEGIRDQAMARPFGLATAAQTGLLLAALLPSSSIGGGAWGLAFLGATVLSGFVFSRALPLLAANGALAVTLNTQLLARKSNTPRSLEKHLAVSRVQTARALYYFTFSGLFFYIYFRFVTGTTAVPFSPFLLFSVATLLAGILLAGSEPFQGTLEEPEDIDS